MRFECIKHHKRLYIVDRETDELRYTPPNFIRLPDRQPMIDLAAKANEKGEIDIGDIIALESKYQRKR